MPIYRAQVAIDVDTNLPRDQMVITPHFKRTNLLPGQGDEDQLAQDLATGVANWFATYPRCHVKLYNAEGSPPHYPLAEYIKNPASPPLPSVAPREIALCLSYYDDTNRPRHRGRLYIPHAWLANASGSATSGPRPVAAQRTSVGALAGIFAGLGGLDVDWVVWSRIDSAARTVKNWYVDDEWDIQRKRGSRPTARTTGTTSG